MYVTRPYSRKLKKLELRVHGPYKVTQVSTYPETGDVISVEIDVTLPGSEKLELKRFPRRRLRPIRSRLPTIDWNNWLENKDVSDRPKDLADLLSIQDAPTDPPAYVAFEDEDENEQPSDKYILDIVEVLSDSDEMMLVE